jgi:hypothetical protein
MFNETGQLHIHFAVPFFAGDQLIRSLTPMAQKLWQEGICVPLPETYRSIISKKAHGAEGGIFMPLEQEDLRKHIPADAKTVILSFNELMGRSEDIFKGGVIYEHAAARIEYLRTLFPNREMSLFFSAANPGSVMCAMMNNGAMSPITRKAAVLMRPLWSDLVERIDAVHPDLPITIWANEDTPVTWPVVLRKITGRARGGTIGGGLVLAAALLSAEGKEKFLIEARQKAPRTERELMVFVNQFLNENADESSRSFEVDLEGWDQKTIDDFDLLYEQDIDFCDDLEQVRIITLDTEICDADAD